MQRDNVSSSSNHIPELYYPKISIITPSYNQGLFIENTIKSVLSQNYPQLEYIIVDGGSTDTTLEIIRKYESFIEYWVSEKDNGQVDAINKGIKKSTGEIIAWINSDDMYSQGTFHKIVNYFFENPDVSVVYGDTRIINEDPSHPDYNLISGPFNFGRLLGGDYIPQPSVFFRRDAIFNVGLLDESLHYSLDYDLLLKLGLKYKFGYIPEVLSMFRWHPTSKSCSQEEKFTRENFIIIDRLLRMQFYGNRYRDISYLHLLHLLALAQNTDTISDIEKKDVPDQEKISGIDGAILFDILIKNFNINLMRKWETSELVSLEQQINCIINIFNTRYSKFEGDFNQISENKRIFKTFLLDNVNYLFERGESITARDLFLTIVRNEKSLMLQKYTIKTALKLAINKKGVQIYNRIFHNPGSR